MAHDYQLESLTSVTFPFKKKKKKTCALFLPLHTETLRSESCIIQNAPLESRRLFNLPAPIMRPSPRLCFSRLNVDVRCCLLVPPPPPSFRRGSFKFIIFSPSPRVIPPHGFTGKNGVDRVEMFNRKYQWECCTVCK